MPIPKAIVAIIQGTLSLIKKYYPGVLLDEKKLHGFASPIDSSAVTSRLQFTPSINWRDLIPKE